MASLVFTCSSFAQTPSPSASGNVKHPFTFEDMMALKRVGAPVPSLGGKWVVFDCEDVDLAANIKVSHLWIVSASGGESRRMNQTPNHESAPVFRPMANDSSGHRKQPIRRKFGCAILTPEAECWLGNHGG